MAKIFRVIDPEIIEYLQNAGLLPPTPDARQMQSNLSKAKLIKATKYFYSDSVFQRLISISLEVMEPAIYQEYHCRALEIFNCKLKSLYFNRTPPLPVVEAHLSEIIYHAIQASRTEAELVQHLVNSLSLLPADPLHLDSFSAALYLDENNELETRLGWSYKITRADFDRESHGPVGGKCPSAESRCCGTSEVSSYNCSSGRCSDGYHPT